MVAQEIHGLIHSKLKNQLDDWDAEVAPELGAKMGLGPPCPPGQITERNSLREMLLDMGSDGKKPGRRERLRFVGGMADRGAHKVLE